MDGIAYFAIAVSYARKMFMNSTPSVNLIKHIACVYESLMAGAPLKGRLLASHTNIRLERLARDKHIESCCVLITKITAVKSFLVQAPGVKISLDFFWFCLACYFKFSSRRKKTWIDK